MPKFGVQEAILLLNVSIKLCAVRASGSCTVQWYNDDDVSLAKHRVA